MLTCDGTDIISKIVVKDQTTMKPQVLIFWNSIILPPFLHKRDLLGICLTNNLNEIENTKKGMGMQIEKRE
jgi:hypothetical protein